MRAFRKYSNQDIYNLLTGNVKEEDLFVKQAGLWDWLKNVGNAIVGRTPAQSPSNTTQPQNGTTQAPNAITEQQKQLQAQLAKAILPLYYFNIYNLKDEQGNPIPQNAINEIRGHRNNILKKFQELNALLLNLQKSPKDSLLKQAFQKATSDLLGNMQAFTMSKLPGTSALRDLMSNTVKSYLPIVETVSPELIMTPDPSSQKNLIDIINEFDASIKVEKIPISEEQRLKEEYAQDKITRDQYNAKLQDIQAKKYFSNINKIIANIGNNAQNPEALQNIDKQLLETITKLPADLDPAVRAKVIDYVGNIASRFDGLQNTRNYVSNAKFGDSKNNQIYKNDYEARKKFMDDYMRYNPQAKKSDIYQKIYGDNTQKASFADYFKNADDSFAMGYDQDTGELVYGSGALSNPWQAYKRLNRVKLDKNFFNSLKRIQLKDLREATDKLMEAGISKEDAMRIALGKARAVHTHSWVSGERHKNPFVYSKNIYSHNPSLVKELESLKDNNIAPPQNKNIVPPQNKNIVPTQTEEIPDKYRS